MPEQKRTAGSRVKGKISGWNDDKGFGFIEPMLGGQRVFIHIKAFANRQRRPANGAVVTYALASDPQGRPCATHAVLAGDKTRNKNSHKRSGARAGSSGALLASLVFFGVLATSVTLGKLPPLLLLLCAGMSLVTYLAYYFDKSAARSGRRRTPENSLHLMALLGGWPGAWLAQQRLRHKSRKQSFRFMFWLTVMANIGALAWLHTADGTAFLRMVVGSYWNLPV